MNYYRVVDDGDLFITKHRNAVFTSHYPYRHDLGRGVGHRKAINFSSLENYGWVSLWGTESSCVRSLKIEPNLFRSICNIAIG